MNLFFAIIASLNRFHKTQALFGWLIGLLVFFQSVLIWASRKEFRSFSDCLLHSRKQAKHPWIHERAIEYPWVYKKITDLTNTKVLDVGAKNGLPTTDMLLANHNRVYTIDINASQSQSTGNLIIMKGDILSTSFEDNFFDAIVIVSTIEHIGIPGRYGVTAGDESGDLRAMQEIFRILSPGGRVLVTIPYGLGKSLPLNRLYNSQRTQELFKMFEIIEAQYYKYYAAYQMWFEVPESTAAKNNWDTEPWYALACFEVRKPNR
jgi:SAM-dependent methyltransferase